MSENLQQRGIDSSVKDTTTDTDVPLSSTHDTDRQTEQRTRLTSSKRGKEITATEEGVKDYTRQQQLGS